MEFSLGQEHQLYKDYPIIHPHRTFIGKTVKYNGQTYECNRSSGFDPHKFLFGRTCFIDTFYEVFKTRLEQYVKDMEIIVT